MAHREAEEAKVAELEALLRATMERPVPAPRDDLVTASLARIRGWLLLHDVLRFITLEGLWKRRDASGRGAEALGARQDR